MCTIKININLYPSSVNIDRIMQKLINSNFKTVLESATSYEFPLYDEKYSGNAIFDALIDEVYYDETSPFWGKKSKDEIKEYVINAGINPESIISWIKNTLLLSKVSKSIQKIFELNPKDKKIIERGEEFMNIYGPGVSVDEIDEKDNERVIIVRSQFGDYDVLAWTINNSSIKSNDPRISHIKALYHYVTGCHYFQARPVLYTTWVNMDDNKKYATVY